MGPTTSASRAAKSTAREAEPKGQINTMFYPGEQFPSPPPVEDWGAQGKRGKDPGIRGETRWPDAVAKKR
jgi:hypothetical protein